ncbi:hypothetical protein JOE34_001808 [Pseudomonas sp. PvP028]|nr:hypothetical protein [Pseudomonas sp. PvP028]
MREILTQLTDQASFDKASTFRGDFQPVGGRPARLQGLKLRLDIQTVQSLLYQARILLPGKATDVQTLGVTIVGHPPGIRFAEQTNILLRSTVQRQGHDLFGPERSLLLMPDVIKGIKHQQQKK